MKFSQLPVATTPLSGDEIAAIVQDGVSKSITVENFGGAAAVAAHVALEDPHSQYVTHVEADAEYVKNSSVGAVGGIASLDASGLVPLTQLPNLPAGRKVAVADEAARLALPVYDDLTIAYQTDDGSTWALDAGDDPSIGSNWSQIGSATSIGVDSFNSRTGNVVPVAGDYDADLITETLNREFVSPTEKSVWNSKIDQTDGDSRYQQLATFQNDVTSVIGASVLAGTGISVSYDNVGGTVTINNTAGESVTSVNSQTGDVVLTAADVGAAEEVHAHASTDITDFEEAVQDAIGATIVAGSNVTVTYDDTLGTLTIDSLAGGNVDSVNGQTGVVVLTADDVGAAEEVHAHASTDITDFEEAVQDVVGAALVAGDNVTVTYDDAIGTITIDVASTVVGVERVNGKTGDVTLTAADVGAAEEVHTHVSTDITDFDDATADVIGVKVIAGDNVEVEFDPLTKETKITASQELAEELEIMMWSGL